MRAFSPAPAKGTGNDPASVAVRRRDAQALPVTGTCPDPAVSLQASPRMLAQRGRFAAAFGMDTRPAASPIAVQRRKTAMPGWHVLKSVMSSAAKGQGTEEQKRHAVWAECEGRYAAARARGDERQQDLEERAWQFALAGEAMHEQLAQQRQAYGDRYAAAYATKVRGHPEDPGLTSVSTAGFIGQRPPDDKMTGQYDNRIDLDTGTIVADNNKATEDPARKAGLGLPNSEVLWSQYREVAARKLPAERVGPSMAGISRMIRANVANETSQQVVFMAYPDGETWIGGVERQWEPGSEEYSAILGTPNAMPAAFMLVDHFDELGGKTLGTITTRPVGPEIEIRLDEPPASQQGEFELDE